MFCLIYNRNRHGTQVSLPWMSTFPRQLLTTRPALEKLNHVSEARYDDSESGRVGCMADTREEILSAIQSWIIGALVQGKIGSSPLFSISMELAILWLHGLAGTGKTTVAQTIASWCDGLGLLGASFFCARTGGRSIIHRIFPTIAHQQIGRAHV